MAKKVKKAPAPQSNWLFRSIVLIAMALMFAGLFGAMIVSKTGDTSSTMDFKQYFEIIKQVSKSGGASTTGASVAETSSYICIGLFILGIVLSALPILITLLRKRDLNIKKLFAFSGVSCLLFVFANTIFWSYSGKAASALIESSATLSCNFGWGSILIIVGFVLGIAGIVLNELFVTKSFISLRNIFAKAGLVLLFFIGIFSGIAATLKVNIYDLVTFETKFSIFEAITALSDNNILGSKASGTGSAAIVFSLASMVFFALVLYKFIYNNPSKKGNSIIVFASLFLVTSFIANICALNYVNTLKTLDEFKEGTTISLGSGAIVDIVLGVAVLAAAILTRIFKRTDKEA